MSWAATCQRAAAGVIAGTSCSRCAREQQKGVAAQEGVAKTDGHSEGLASSSRCGGQNFVQGEPGTLLLRRAGKGTRCCCCPWRPPRLLLLLLLAGRDRERADGAALVRLALLAVVRGGHLPGPSHGGGGEQTWDGVRVCVRVCWIRIRLHASAGRSPATGRIRHLARVRVCLSHRRDGRPPPAAPRASGEVTRALQRPRRVRPPHPTLDL